MTAATAQNPGLDLGKLAETLAPGSFRFDPFGLVSGYKTYQIFTALSAKSDAELADLGITRTDLPAMAIKAADNLRAA